MIQKTRQSHYVRQGQIFEAVSKLIATKGMDSVAIRDIAHQVGVSEGAIYRHFASKREIFYVIHKWNESLLNTLQSDSENGIPALETMERASYAGPPGARDGPSSRGSVLLQIGQGLNRT